MILVVSITGMVLYGSEDDAGEWVDTDNTPFVTYLSIGSHGKDHEYYDNTKVNVMIGLHTVFMIMCIIGGIVFRNIQSKVIN
jgi:Ni,Fe-hydrogenase I cytochrome b subunit